MDSINSSMMLYNNSKLEQLKAASLSENKNMQKNKELYDACVDFESLFIKQMLDTMRKTVHRTSFSDSPADNSSRDFFEDMLYDNYAKKIAETANLGIAKMMYLQLYKAQSI